MTSVRIPTNLMRWLRGRAKEERRSLAYLIEEALTERQRAMSNGA